MPILFMILVVALGILLFLSFWSVLVICIGLGFIYYGLQQFKIAKGWVKWLHPIVVILGIGLVISQWKFALFVTIVSVGFYYINKHKRANAKNRNQSVFEYKP